MPRQRPACNKERKEELKTQLTIRADGEERTVEVDDQRPPLAEDFYAAVGSPLGGNVRDINGEIPPVRAGVALWLRMAGAFMRIDEAEAALWRAASTPVSAGKFLADFGEDAVESATSKGLVVRFPHDGASEDLLDLAADLIACPRGYSIGQKKQYPRFFEVNQPNSDTALIVGEREYLLWAYIDARSTLADVMESVARHHEIPIEEVRRYVPGAIHAFLRARTIALDWDPGVLEGNEGGEG